MKPNLHIVLVLVLLLLVTNIIGQTKNQKYLSLERKYELLDISKKNIVVISILNMENTNEIQKLDDLAENYKNKNVTFIVVTDDNLNDDKINLSKNEYLHFLSKKENNKIFNTYQTGVYKVFPMHIVLNKEGKIIYKKKGITNNIENKLAKRINRLLKKDCKSKIDFKLKGEKKSL